MVSAPKMLTRNGASAFQFETDDPTYGGTLNMISWAALSQDVVHVLAYKSTGGYQIFNMGAIGPADDGSHRSEFNLRGEHGILQCRTSLQGGAGDLTSMSVKGTELEFNAVEGAIRLTVTDEFDNTITPLRVDSDGVKVTRDASGPAPWKSFVLEHDRSNATPYSGQASDILWTARTPNAIQDLSVLEMTTNNITLDANGDYTDFSNKMELWVTSMTAGSKSWHQVWTFDKDAIVINAPIKSYFVDGNIMAGEWDGLLDQQRHVTQDWKWDRSRSAMRCTTNADRNDGNGIQQFNDGFGTDTSYSLNNTEVGLIGVQVNNPSFNVDNTLDYGAGQSAFFNVQLRGEDYPQGAVPLQALKIEPWSSRYTMNTAYGTDNLRLETNAPAVEDTKPHVFVNLTTTERDALTAESGMMIFNTTDVKLQCYDGTTWNNLH